jgi:hypothetical protein
MHGRSLSAWVLAALLIASASAVAKPTRVFQLKPDKGFIDDPMAFDSGETQLAYVHTDAGQFMNLVILKIPGYTKAQEIKLEDATLVPKRLVFTPDGKQLVLVWMDGHSGNQGVLLVDVASGKVGKKLGPENMADVATYGDEQVIALTTTKTDAKTNDTTYTVTALRTKDLKKVGQGKVVVQADQTLKSPELRVLYFEPGNLTLVGMKKGDYDKKRDIRRPEQAVRFDVLARKAIWRQEPQDVVQWTKATNMRPNHPGQYRFLEVSDDLKSIHTVDKNNELGEVKTPGDWSLYEAKSLVQAETWDGKTLYFSMTIDPVNPAAVKRKKADIERMDLYRFDPGPKSTPLGQVQTDKRKFGWTVGKTLFSYLRKLKGFSRGGNELEVWKIE